MRTTAVVVSALAAFSTLASAQTALSCAVDARIPPTVRAGGKTELVGDLIFNCTGGTPSPVGSPVPLYMLKLQAQSTTDSITFAPVNITSRQLASDGASEAILLIDEPHSPTNPSIPLLACGDSTAPATAGVCTILGSGTGVNTYNGTANRPNVFQAKQIAADTLQWTGIPFDPPGMNTTRTLRVTNVRMNVSQTNLSAASFNPSVVQLTSTLTSPAGAISLTGGLIPGTLTVAFIQRGLVLSTNTPVSAMPLQQCQASNTFLTNNPTSTAALYSFWVRVQEGFHSALKRKNLATDGVNANAYPANGDMNQNVPGGWYSTETAFENLGPARDPNPNPPVGSNVIVTATPAFPSSLISAGLANNGTRVALTFNSVPSGVSVFVPTTIKLVNQLYPGVTGQAVLVSSDSNGVGSFAAVASNGGSIANFGANASGLAQVPVSSGSGIAAYEILYSDSFSLEEFSVPIALSYSAGVPPTGVTATLTVGPAPLGSGTADALSPIPRFSATGADTLNAQPLFYFTACGASNITLTSSTRTFTPNDTPTFTASITPAPSVAGGQVTFTVDQVAVGVAPVAADGTAKFGINITQLGAHDVTATYVTPAPGSQAISATAQVLITQPLVVAPFSSTPQTVLAGTPFSALSVTVRDPSGTVRSGVPVLFTAPASGASGTFSNGSSSITATTTSAGVASVPFTANTTFGAYQVTAVADSGRATFVLTNSGTPASMTAKPGTTPQSTLTSTFFNPLAVTVKDATGIPLPGVSVTFTSPATGPSAYANFYPNPATAHTDNSGVVSLPFFASSFAGGPYAVTASTTGLPPVTFLLTNIAGPPVIQTYVQDQTAALLSTVVFTVFVYEYPYPPVRWQVSTNGGVTFTDIPGATLTTLTLTAVTFSMNGNQYRAVVTNAVGSTSTMPANLTVNRPAPVITWANPADITAGTALGSTQLNATASVPGSFAYVPAAGTVLAEGSGQTLTAVFTPTDSNNFMVALKSVTINVLSSAVPSVLSLTPVTSSTSTQTFTLQFSHPSGYTSLSVLNVLINSALDGRKGCYLAYVQQTNTAYLVNDAGDASAPFAGALVLNGSGTSIGNSQCSITAAGSSAVGAGTTLTLTLNMTFTASFAGNKVIYAAARDSAQGNSGWQTLGVHGVPGSPVTYPNSVSMSPASGSTSSAAITFSYQDATSAANLQTVWALVNTALDGRAACYVAYYRPGNLLFLIPDNGDGSQATSIVLSGTNTLSNSQCTISAQGSSVSTPTAGTLAVTLNIAFKSGFTGPKAVWMAGQTLAGQTSAWQSLGAWRVP